MDAMVSFPQSIFGAVIFATGIAGMATIAMSVPTKGKRVEAAEIVKEHVTKGDRIYPSIIRTIPLVVQAKPEPPAERPSKPVVALAVEEPVPPPNEPPVRRHWHLPDPSHHMKVADVCQRHGGHKVDINHGKSWRCSFK